MYQKNQIINEVETFHETSLQERLYNCSRCQDDILIVLHKDLTKLIMMFMNYVG